MRIFKMTLRVVRLGQNPPLHHPHHPLRHLLLLLVDCRSLHSIPTEETRKAEGRHLKDIRLLPSKGSVLL